MAGDYWRVYLPSPLCARTDHGSNGSLLLVSWLQSGAGQLRGLQLSGQDGIGGGSNDLIMKPYYWPYYS